ncbi:hypothetical protein V1522DRAFT_430554 [Lipomyces starkeyi]
MTPIAVQEPVANNVYIADLKAEVVVDHVEVEATPKPPVADDFMYETSEAQIERLAVIYICKFGNH